MYDCTAHWQQQRFPDIGYHPWNKADHKGSWTWNPKAIRILHKNLVLQWIEIFTHYYSLLNKSQLLLLLFFGYWRYQGHVSCFKEGDRDSKCWGRSMTQRRFYTKVTIYLAVEGWEHSMNAGTSMQAEETVYEKY